MFGVVLWSNPQERKAVIWCEDHGDLAFYAENDVASFDDLGFDTGDLVQFDIQTDRHLRYAHNPQVVTEGLYLSLSASLERAESTPEQAPQGSAQIIPFRSRQPVAACRGLAEMSEQA
ncbi:hypothetical protein [Aestuariivita sp.]|jgi:hypothetical protein|uniref:hypothetical protein n=1 Tax=Aestuariivita sp. TaxID=1872407 RepID=UPI002173A452|nr:hypothetical protein [Aestuariivita sp.]MCE8006712.1 hypothetical protein [Aestuariivita sp.]